MLLYEHAPTLDLHGEDRTYARIRIKEFLDDQVKMKSERIVIIHGKGLGILKKVVQDVLAKDKRVEHYELNLFNDGETLVQLKKNN